MKIIEIKREKGLPSVDVDGKVLDVIESSDQKVCAHCELMDISEVQNGLFPEELTAAMWNEKGFGSPLFKEMSVARKGEGILLEFAFRPNEKAWQSIWDLKTYISTLMNLAGKSQEISVTNTKLENIGGGYLTFSLEYGIGRSIGESVADAEKKIIDFLKLTELTLIKDAKTAISSGEKDKPLPRLEKDLLETAGFYAVCSALCKIELFPKVSVANNPYREILLEGESSILRLQVRVKQEEKWIDLVSDFHKDDFFVLVDFSEKMLRQVPDIYILDLETWKKLLVDEKKRFPQIKVDDKGIFYPPNWKGLCLSKDQVEDSLNAWTRISEAVEQL